MPQYNLPAADLDRSLTAFARGFIEAAFFSETAGGYAEDSRNGFFSAAYQRDLAEGSADGSIPGDSDAGDIHQKSLVAVKTFCAEFEVKAAPLLSRAYGRGDYDETQAGADLYFTYAGHGVGYWDREQLGGDGLGDELSAACGRGEICLSARKTRSKKAPAGFWVDFYIG